MTFPIYIWPTIEVEEQQEKKTVYKTLQHHIYNNLVQILPGILVT